MTKLLVDPAMAGKLRNLKNDPVFLCDASGRVLGRVVPASQYDNVTIPFTEDELRQAEEEHEEFTLGEILADLEKK